MSAVAVSSSSLNPDAPLFIPAALLQVEDFSPQWWDLVTTTAWFRDHWSREHTQLDEMAQELDAAGLLPDDDEDLFYDDQPEHAPAAVEATQHAAPSDSLRTGTDLSRRLQFAFDSGHELIFIPACTCPPLCRCGAQGAEPVLPEGRRRAARVPGEAQARREADQVRRQPQGQQRPACDRIPCDPPAPLGSSS